MRSFTLSNPAPNVAVLPVHRPCATTVQRCRQCASHTRRPARAHHCLEYELLVGNRAARSHCDYKCNRWTHSFHQSRAWKRSPHAICARGSRFRRPPEFAGTGRPADTVFFPGFDGDVSESRWRHNRTSFSISVTLHTYTLLRWGDRDMLQPSD